MSHTPGPWRTFDTAYGAVHIVKRASDSHMTDVVVINRERNENAAADARLIAAAPDLLAALREMMSAMDDGSDEPTLVDARAAIAKAEGRS